MPRHHLVRRPHVKGLVRPCSVVHADGIGYGASGCDEVQLAVVEEPGVLHRVVHPLGKRVVQRVARLRHADPRLDGHEHPHIFLGGVLHAPVRVVYQPRDIYAEVSIASDGHCQGPCRAVRRQRLMEAPPHNVAREGIREQGKVAEALAATNIGDVGHHQVSRAPGHQSGGGVQQVGIDAVVVVGVRRPRLAALPAQHQPVGAEDVEETVAAKRELHPEVLTAKLQKLPTARLRKVARSTDVVAVKHHARDEDVFLAVLVFMLVLAPSGYAK